MSRRQRMLSFGCFLQLITQLRFLSFVLVLKGVKRAERVSNFRLARGQAGVQILYRFLVIARDIIEEAASSIKLCEGVVEAPGIRFVARGGGSFEGRKSTADPMWQT